MCQYNNTSIQKKIRQKSVHDKIPNQDKIIKSNFLNLVF